MERNTELKIEKMILWGLWFANLAIIFGFWFYSSGQFLFNGWSELLLGLGRLAGLLATFCVLMQFVAMGRLGWLEPIFGMDRLAIFHRRNGIAVLILILLHPPLISLGYMQITGFTMLQQISYTLLNTPFVAFAALGLLLLLLTICSSIYIARKHLKFETWYFVHLANYLAILLIFGHQFANGSTLLGNPWFKYYWIGLYVFTALNLIVWRFLKPVYKFFYHDFKVQQVVAETPTATSVYISGKNMQNFKAEGGQFVLVRFLTKELGLQEHPFSLSMIPDRERLRLTIRQLGDFTNQVPGLKPGTPVVVSGPFGSFTQDRQITDKVLFIAGGIGITPIRSLIEERVKNNQKQDAVLVYASRNLKEIALKTEIEHLCSQAKIKLINVLSEEPTYNGEKGYVDAAILERLVPDIKSRDVFICGPPVMVDKIYPALEQLRVPKQLIHAERFSLHKQ
ncbi:MAG TPA: ferric reductase-like transmembrane domain-containing protein [Candidatus Saccharimonadales bacterium]|nr:ferric reductase-like transmembrane domain-containing protein [Candidatus Saccharimonadales bacterium]